tara:strand:- start:1529 stop:1870 length:342 start_codon:yes stop_codon:yes gene_type:complete
MFTYVVLGWDNILTQVVNQPMPISYKEMVECVGGYIEGVYLDGATAYVNEEGKLQGLHKNMFATDLAHAHNAIYGDDYIAGNMLIVGNCDDEGETMTLTTEWIDANLKEIANV